MSTTSHEADSAGVAGVSPRTATGAGGLTRGMRLSDVDLLRGLVIVIMALDHVRDFVHADSFLFDPLDVAHTTPLLYATRWITHFCAPTFVFLAGVSAWLQAVKGKQGAELSRFLATRGLWLVIVEATVVSVGWSFGYVLFLQVIFAIGVSMLALSLLVRLPRGAVLAIGLLIVAGHNLFDGVKPEQLGALAWLWQLLHEGGPIVLNGTFLGVQMYPVLPWIGIMAVGYGMGPVFTMPPERRDPLLRKIGLAMLVAFVLLRGFDVYGDPSISAPHAHGLGTPSVVAPDSKLTWHEQPTATATVMKFLDVQKYPPSLLYVLATLGTVFVLYGGIARISGGARRVLLTFGAVPFFLYVAHLYLVHALAMAASAIGGKPVAPYFNYMQTVFTKPETLEGLGYPLPIVYLVWVIALLLLYPACAWFAGVKQRRREWWMSYL